MFMLQVGEIACCGVCSFWTSAHCGIKLLWLHGGCGVDLMSVQCLYVFSCAVVLAHAVQDNYLSSKPWGCKFEVRKRSL